MEEFRCQIIGDNPDIPTQLGIQRQPTRNRPLSALSPLPYIWSSPFWLVRALSIKVKVHV